MKRKAFITSLLLMFIGTLYAQDFVRIKNRWKKDGRTEYKIHIENATVDAGAVKPNWWSAQWVFEKVRRGNYYKIRNRWKKDGRTNYYLRIKNGKLVAEGLRFPHALSAQWSLKKVPGTNYYRIQNRHYSKYYLHIENKTLEAGRIKPNWWSAQWELEGFKEKTRTVTRAPKPKKKKNIQRKIRVKLQQIKCLLSDDEGPANDADMDRFRLQVTPKYFRYACARPKGSQAARVIYDWRGPEKQFKKGQTHYVGRNAYSDIILDNDCSIGKFSLGLYGYAREQDNGSSSADEEASKTLILTGNKMFGTHILTLKSSDFIFTYRVTVSKVGW